MTIEHLNILIKHHNLLVTRYDRLDSYIDEIEQVNEFRVTYRGRSVSICDEETSAPSHSEIVSEPFFREMKDVYLKNLKMLRSELGSKIDRICAITKRAQKALDDIEVLEDIA